MLTQLLGGRLVLRAFTEGAPGAVEGQVGDRPAVQPTGR